MSGLGPAFFDGIDEITPTGAAQPVAASRADAARWRKPMTDLQWVLPERLAIMMVDGEMLEADARAMMRAAPT